MTRSAFRPFETSGLLTGTRTSVVVASAIIQMLPTSQLTLSSARICTRSAMFQTLMLVTQLPRRAHKCTQTNPASLLLALINLPNCILAYSTGTTLVFAHSSARLSGLLNPSCPFTRPKYLSQVCLSF